MVAAMAMAALCSEYKLPASVSVKPKQPDGRNIVLVQEAARGKWPGPNRKRQDLDRKLDPIWACSSRPNFWQPEQI